MQEYAFSVYSASCVEGLTRSLSAVIRGREAVFLCIGSDVVAGDSLSPLVGSLLKEYYKIPCYVYGELQHTVTAKEVMSTAKLVRSLHPNALLVAIDASVGDLPEVGTIRLREGGLLPGKGVGKELPAVGDFSLLGVVSPRGKDAYHHLELTRIGFVYRMAESIARAVFQAVLTANGESASASL